MQRRARKIKNESYPVGDPRRWDPGLGSLKRRDRKPLLTENERIDEYVKHRPHYLALGRWINMGRPDVPVSVRLNSKQTRATTRVERMKLHARRLARFG